MQSTTSNLTPAGQIPGVGSSGWFSFRFFCHPNGPDGLPAKLEDLVTEEDGELVHLHKDGTETRFV